MKTKSGAAFSDLNDSGYLRIEVFAVCEAAQESQGRLNLLGTFESICASALPVNVPSMAVAIRLRFWPEELGAHRCGLRLVDSDGEFVVQPMAVEFGLHPQDEDRACGYNLIVQLRDVSFARRGEYSFDFYLDGELEASLPLAVTAPSEKWGAPGENQ